MVQTRLETHRSSHKVGKPWLIYNLILDNGLTILGVSIIALFFGIAIYASKIDYSLNILQNISMDSLDQPDSWKHSNMSTRLTISQGFKKASSININWIDTVEFKGKVYQVWFKRLVSSSNESYKYPSSAEARLCPLMGSEQKYCYIFIGRTSLPD